MPQDRSLAGRVSLITRVSRRAGIGFAIAQHLAERGAHLFLHGLASDDAEWVTGQVIDSTGGA